MKRSPTQTELDLPASKRTVASPDEPEQNPPDLTNDDYTVGWICALAIELAASQAMLDEIHPDLPLEPGDSNIYTLGRMGQHNIAMVCLPEGTTGTNAAATAANDLLRSFRKVRFGLMVGVGGGAPSLPNDDPFKDVRLGDVVVSTPQGSHGGVIQYDFGKTVAQGNFIQTGSLNKPPSVLLAGVAKLKANYMRGNQKLGSYMTTMLELYPSMKTGFVYPGKECDQLFDADYGHVDMRPKCDECDQTRILDRQSRLMDDPVVHYGLIGSANQVMRHGPTREKLRRQYGILCFEMEAAGLMENFPCIIIRGICDYSDAHKNKRWQGYAAVTAAGYAKELLSYIPSDTVKSTTDAVKIMNMVRTELVPLHEKLNPLLDDRARQETIKIFDWLAPPNYEAQYVHSLRKRREGTGQWFLDSSQFAAWTRGDIQNLLCPGIPGAGKTVLASIIIHHLRADPQNKVAFLFCNYGRQEEQTPHGLFSMLLRQLAEQGSAIHELITDLYSAHCPKHTRPSVEEMRNAVRYLSQKSQIFVVLDALDECREETRTFLLHEIRHLQEVTGMRFLMTTRPNHELERRFLPHERLEIRANKSDMMTYVEGQLRDFSECVQKSMGLQDSIKRKIAEVSDGMFLLAVLYTKSLKSERSEGDIEDALQNLSQDKNIALQTVYRAAIERIERQSDDDRYWARRVLYWVIHAKRPLSPSELQHALAVKTESSELQRKYLPAIAELIPLCGGLISFDQESNHVRFVHYTALQYFQKSDDLPEWVYSAPVEISRTCLTYLAFDIFAAGRAPNDQLFEQRMKENALLDYAARYWGYHARESQSDIQSVAISFLQRESLVCCASQVIFAETRYREDGYSQRFPQMAGIHLTAWFGLDFIMSKLLMNDPQRAKSLDSYKRTPLHLSSCRGYKKTTQLLLRHDIDINARDKDGRTALNEASNVGHGAVVQTLLEYKADTSVKDRWGWTALHTAAGHGHDKVIRQLMFYNRNLISMTDFGGRTALHRAAERGHIDVVRLLETVACVKDNEGYTALHVAAEKGHEEVVKLLMKATRLKSKFGWTALHKAASNGHANVVQLLLNSGEDANEKDNEYRTALYRGAENGHENVVNVFLKKQMDLSVKDKWGLTVLHGAAANGHGKVVSLLLNFGVDLEAKTRSGWTAMHEAATNGHKGVVQLLLTHNSDIEARTESGSTALHVAASSGRGDVVQSLLEHHANVDSTDKSGRTPIHEAVSGGFEEVVLLLLEHNANKGAADCEGQTPLDEAINCSYEEIVQILED